MYHTVCIYVYIMLMLCAELLALHVLGFCLPSTSSSVSLAWAHSYQIHEIELVNYLKKVLHFYCDIRIISVYYEGGYSDIVEEKAEEAMNLSVEEVKVLPEYSVKGEVSIS